MTQPRAASVLRERVAPCDFYPELFRNKKLLFLTHLSFIYIPTCTMLALANPPMEARSDGFFEKMDVKKNEEARH